MRFRDMMPVMLALSTIGCSQYGTSGPNDLGLVQRFDPATLPVSLSVSSSTPITDATRRNQVLSAWIVRSDYLCNNYQLGLSRTIRDSRLATDAVATVLSGLATILAPVATKTALSGAATITLGVGGDLQSDLFAQQAGEVVTSAIQTVRYRARKDLQDKMQASYESYTLEQGLVDVQRYDQETCNLNVGLNELRASLIIGPDAKRPNNPILPLPPQSLFPGVGPVAPPQLPDGFVPRGPGDGSGAGIGTRPPIKGSGAVALNPGPQASIEGAVDEEKNILPEMGRRIQSGLCLAPDKGKVSFGPTTKGAITLFRQTSAGKTLFGARSAGGLSSEEAVYLANKDCDTRCFKNAYERYQYIDKDAVDTLIAELNKVKPNVIPPGTNSKRICDLREQIRAVQDELPAFAQWKNTGGVVTPEFAVKLRQEQPRSRLDQ